MEPTENDPHLAEQVRLMRISVDKTLAIVTLQGAAISGISDRTGRIEVAVERFTKHKEADDRRLTLLERFPKLSWLRVSVAALVLLVSGCGIAIAAQVAIAKYSSPSSSSPRVPATTGEK